jgi:YegS/Rv2252/BmrU family lipid kinase
MKMSQQKSWFAVVNPRSANGRTQGLWPGYYQQLRQVGIQVDYALTSRSGGGTEITRTALNEGYRRIIAVGGDGTVNEVLNGLIENDRLIADDIELAVFEQGTGGDFARTIRTGKEKGLNSFIRMLKEPNIILSDIGRVDFLNFKAEEQTRYFLNASNVGVGAEAVHRTNSRSKAMGSKLSYLTSTLVAVLSYKSACISLEMDKDTFWEGNIWGLMVCNGQYIGGGMRIAPDARVDDGLFDLVVIKEMRLRRLFSCFPLLYKGKHIHLPEVQVFRCRELALYTPDSMLFETDGEILGVSPKAYRIIPKCLKIWV